MKPFVKTVLFFLLCTACAAPSLVAQATNYRAVEWDVARLAIANSLNDNIGAGFAFGTEVRYNASNRFSGGLRLEGAAFGKDNGDDSADVHVNGSWVLIGDYYFEEELAARPFAGFGVGLFNGTRGRVVDVNDSRELVDDIRVGSALGFVPRVGIELGHFRLSLEYNIIAKAAVPNYLALQFAGTLFGGRK